MVTPAGICPCASATGSGRQLFVPSPFDGSPQLYTPAVVGEHGGTPRAGGDRDRLHSRRDLPLVHLHGRRRFLRVENRRCRAGRRSSCPRHRSHRRRRPRSRRAGRSRRRRCRHPRGSPPCEICPGPDPPPFPLDPYCHAPQVRTFSSFVTIMAFIPPAANISIGETSAHSMRTVDPPGHRAGVGCGRGPPRGRNRESRGDADDHGTCQATTDVCVPSRHC